MRISESQPLPPGWVERYDEQGNVWFDIRDDERSEPPESEPAPSVPPTTQPPMASMSFAQRFRIERAPINHPLFPRLYRTIIAIISEQLPILVRLRSPTLLGRRRT
ncbi:hypothetical protein CPB85DRAFT_374201 [Mucidula mucida]|nr:hypothetical protein CPB85DRAFT_374201 [Mucidula mucida]